MCNSTGYESCYSSNYVSHSQSSLMTWSTNISIRFELTVPFFPLSKLWDNPLQLLDLLLCICIIALFSFMKTGGTTGPTVPHLNCIFICETFGDRTSIIARPTALHSNFYAAAQSCKALVHVTPALWDLCTVSTKWLSVLQSGFLMSIVFIILRCSITIPLLDYIFHLTIHLTQILLSMSN
jgi:hypothetical protein